MFPMTVTIHSPAQLNAVLNAMRPELRASDFADPAVGAAYEEAAQRVAQNEASAAGVSVTEKAEALGNANAQATTAAGGRRTASKDPSSDAPTKTADARASSTAESAAASPQDSTAAEPIPYAKVADAITAAVKRSRQHAVDTLKRFGATKGPELKPEQYADFLAALEA